MANGLVRRSSPHIRPARRITYKAFMKDATFLTIFSAFEETIQDQGICTFGQILKTSGFSNFADSIPWPFMRRRYEEKHDAILMPLSRDKDRKLVPSESAGARAPVGYALIDKRNSNLIKEKLAHLNSSIEGRIMGGKQLISNIRRAGGSAIEPQFVAGSLEFKDGQEAA